MFARLLATLVCVLNSALCFGQAEAVAPPEHRVMVYLSNDSGQSPQILDQMKREVAGLMEPAGYSVLWQIGHGSAANIAGAEVVVLELRGVCRPLAATDPLTPVVNGVSLASSAVEDGHILPFSWVECATLSNLLAPYLPAQSDQSESLYGQAMGRLAAHELFHILTKTSAHDETGVAKESFSATNLLGQSFTFDLPAIAKFRDSASADPDATTESAEDHDNGIAGR